MGHAQSRFLFGSGSTCQDKEAVCQHLNLYLWPIAKTEIPGGMAGHSALGRHDYVLIILSAAYEEGRDRSTRMPSCSGEQQRGAPFQMWPTSPLDCW